MKTKAVRIYGVDDLRLEEFDLPEIKDDEILVQVVSDSICMSSHKLAMQGNKHKRVRADLAAHPVIIGHEFCGIIEKAGSRWAEAFKAGNKMAIQPALNVPDGSGKATLWAPGYSYEYIGGDATYIILPKEVMEMNCLLHYSGDNFYLGSLAEPVSCVVGAFHAQYHTKAAPKRVPMFTIWELRKAVQRFFSLPSAPWGLRPSITRFTIPGNPPFWWLPTLMMTDSSAPLSF